MSAADHPRYAVASPEARRAAWATTERAILRSWGGQSAETRRFVARWPGLGDHAQLHAALPRHARGSSRFVADAVGSGRTARPSFAEAVIHTVRRHLAAFGPATVADIASWTAIRIGPIRIGPIREALAALAPGLREFADEHGRALYDLARAPRPPADTPAPVRFLAKWDSPLLAYGPTDRVRILPERYRASVIAKNGDVVPTVLVDGLAAARWDARLVRNTAVLRVAALGRLGAEERVEIAAEGEHLVRFIHPEAAAHEVRFVAPGSLPAANLARRP